LLGCVGCEPLVPAGAPDAGRYCGRIVPDGALRSGFADNLELALSLDWNQLATTPGRLSSADADNGPCAPEPSFQDAPLSTSNALAADALSGLTFGSSHTQNFIAHVPAQCGPGALAVVTLLENETVELRLLRPTDVALEFGLFPLSKKSCTASP
jgi:hypothetical protein